MEPKSYPVSFRLEPDLYKRLVRLGKLSGISHHAMGRTMVVRALESTDQQELHQVLTVIDDELSALRSALGRGVGAILQNVTDLGEDAIREWVHSRLLGAAEQEKQSFPDMPDEPDDSDESDDPDEAEGSAE